MAILYFKLEYYKGIGGAADEGVFIHCREDMPVYQSKITKEQYYGVQNNHVTAFLTDLFNVDGVEVLSSMAFRLYVERSPVYHWSEVLGPVVEIIRIYTGCSSISEIQGSGITLQGESNRRPTTF